MGQVGLLLDTLEYKKSMEATNIGAELAQQEFIPITISNS